MNTQKSGTNVLSLGSILAAALAFALPTLRAGAPLPSGAYHRVGAVVSANDVSTVKSDAVAMACGACKTTAITERRLLPGAKAGTALFAVGSRHECAMCGGEITTMNGTTTNSMAHNCVVCGQVTVSCCVAPAAAKNG